MNPDQIARVRFLSTRFLELQGFRVALAGATIAAVFGSYLVVARPTETGVWVALAIAGVLLFPGQWWLHRYYAQNFGRQVPQRRNLVPTMVFLSIYFAIASFLNRHFEAIPAGGPTAATVVVAAVAVAIRDWPWRGHYFAAAAAVAAVFSANVFGVGVIDRGMTMTATFFACGLSMIVVGLLDHRLLVKLMADVRIGEVPSTIQRVQD